MIPIEDGNSSNLATLRSGTLSSQAKPLTVGGLEHALLTRFPAADAEDWDRTGLVVGDPAELVKEVAVALDPTLDAIAAAHRIGANVLVTHHPVFIEPPTMFSPNLSRASVDGAAVYEAAKNGVSLMSFHTALDANPASRAGLPRMLHLDFKSVLMPFTDDAEKGYGHICIPEAGEKLTLRELAARCTSVFKRAPRVYGDFSTKLERIVCATGSAGSLVDACLHKDIDCLVCGEIRYHEALAAKQAGLAVVELGHDASELPLAAVLAAAVGDAGVASDAIHVFDQSDNWAHPETTRI